MKHQSARGAVTMLTPVIIGGLAGLAALYAVFAHQQTDFGNLALGLNTRATFLDHGGQAIHCRGSFDADPCAADAAKSTATSRALILSASQLYAVNDYVDGDRTAPWLLADAARRRGRDVVTYSMPNANFQEMERVFLYARRQMKLDALVLPLVYDDMREQGIRDTVAVLGADGAPAARKQAATGGAPAEKSLQDRSEQALTGWLDVCCEMWRLRSEARGWAEILSRRAMHVLAYVRNRYTRDLSQFRIPVPAADYAINRAALERMVAAARGGGMPVLLYVVPRPTDFFPYDPDGYRAFKDDMAALARRHGAALANLEDAVPDELWGTTEITLGYPVRDHFHFKAAGHALLAQALDPLIARVLP